MGETGLAG